MFDLFVWQYMLLLLWFLVRCIVLQGLFRVDMYLLNKGV